MTLTQSLKRFLVLMLLCAMTLHLSGCQLLTMFHKDAPKAADNSDSGDDATGDQPAATDNSQPLGPTPAIQNYRPFTVTTPDGLKLVGTLYIPGISPYKPTPTPGADADSGDSADSAAGGDNGDASPDTAIKEAKTVKPAAVQYPLIIMFHMLSGDRWDWKELPRHLVEAGYAVLVFDMRGHGESVYHGTQLKVWRNFDKDDWQRMVTDPDQLIGAIAKDPHYNMINTHRIGLIGASIGANIAINYASRHNNDVLAIVLLSPGLEYHGIQAMGPIGQYGNGVYMAASKQDSYAADSAEKLYTLAHGKKKIKIFEDIGHGTDMLDNNPDLGKDIVSWLTGILPGNGEGDNAVTTPEAPTDAAKKKPSPATPKPSAKSEKPGEKPKTTPKPSPKKLPVQLTPTDKVKLTPSPAAKGVGTLTGKPSPSAAHLPPHSPTPAPSGAPSLKPPVKARKKPVHSPSVTPQPNPVSPTAAKVPTPTPVPLNMSPPPSPYTPPAARF